MSAQLWPWTAKPSQRRHKCVAQTPKSVYIELEPSMATTPCDVPADGEKNVRSTSNILRISSDGIPWHALSDPIRSCAVIANASLLSHGTTLTSRASVAQLVRARDC